jgi:hypothetical protein
VPPQFDTALTWRKNGLESQQPEDLPLFGGGHCIETARDAAGEVQQGLGAVGRESGRLGCQQHVSLAGQCGNLAADLGAGHLQAAFALRVQVFEQTIAGDLLVRLWTA